jgi:hypothetical protein
MRLAIINPWGWLSFVAALNALLPAALKTLSDEGFFIALSLGFGHSFVIWISLIIVYLLAVRTLCVSRLNARLLPLYGFISLLLIVPWAQLSWVCCALAAVIWGAQKGISPTSRTASVVMFAVAIREPTTQLCLTLFADQILTIDATLATALLWLFSDAVEIQSNIIKPSGEFSLMILTGCSAFGNLSLALLLWLAFTLHRQSALIPQDMLRACLIITTVLFINSLRLALMSLSEPWYTRLHIGDGANIVNGLVLIVPLLFVRWSRHDQPKTRLFSPTASRFDYRAPDKGV